MTQMSAAEVAAIRHLTGHTLDSLATHMGVNPQTPRRWESGRDRISETAATALLEVLAEHTALVEQMLNANTPIRLPRKPAGDRPRGWYVAAAARVMEVEPDTEIEWTYENDTN